MEGAPSWVPRGGTGEAVARQRPRTRRGERSGAYHRRIRAWGVEGGDDLVQHGHIEGDGEIQKLLRAGERHGYRVRRGSPSCGSTGLSPDYVADTSMRRREDTFDDAVDAGLSGLTDGHG